MGINSPGDVRHGITGNRHLIPATILDKPSRIALIDIARGTALVAMAIYHFTFDLGMFGLIPPETAVTGGWKVFARSIAFSFLFLVGISLVLATANGIDWRRTAKRLAMVGGAALVITIATYVATPETYIYFGILHHIAIASVLGLALRAQAPVVLASLAGAIFALWWFMPFTLEADALAFLGLTRTPPLSSDFVPLVPWLAAVLLGMAAAKVVPTARWTALSPSGPIWLVSPLSWLGRHSLAFYLLHQPILIGLIYGALAVAGRI